MTLVDLLLTVVDLHSTSLYIHTSVLRMAPKKNHSKTGKGHCKNRTPKAAFIQLQWLNNVASAKSTYVSSRNEIASFNSVVEARMKPFRTNQNERMLGCAAEITFTNTTADANATP